MTAVLDVRHLIRHYRAGKHRLFRHQAAQAVRAVDDVSFRRRRGNAGPGGRERLRQDHHRLAVLDLVCADGGEA